MRLVFLALALTACKGPSGETDRGSGPGDDTDPVGTGKDRDGDGYDAEADCDDDDDQVHPGGNEIPYDGRDNDCDAGTPDDDQDGDGYLLADDCDDYDADAHPGATEVWYDGTDQDCDGASDFDADGDGHDSDAHGGGDCEDDVPSVNPDADEICGNGYDDDCDGGSGGCGWTGDVAVSSADAKWLGIEYSGMAGDELGSAGDVTGDGNADLLVASPAKGRVWLVAGGGSGTTSLSAATATITHTTTNSEIGSAMLGPGDANGDGVDDLLIAAPWASYKQGTVLLFLGPVSGTLTEADADATVTGERGDDAAGTGIAALGDIDGDGGNDIAVGAPGYSYWTDDGGRVYIVTGMAGGSLSTAPWIDGERVSASAGAALASGDFDGDGEMDLAVGAPAYWSTTPSEPKGAVYMVRGPFVTGTSLKDADGRWLGERATSKAGDVLAGPGDLDGDGNDDLLVGANADDGGGTYGNGAAYVLLGGTFASTTLASADGRLYGAANGERLGWAISGVGDVDGDGQNGFLVGDPQYNEGSNSDCGATYLFDGAPTGTFATTDAEATFYGEVLYHSSGSAVAGPGDMNGDGVDDLAIGAFYDNEATTWAGAAFVFYGATGW